MVLTLAYIVYRFFKRFPLAIVFVLLSQSCFSTAIEKKTEEEVKEVEWFVGNSDELSDRENVDSSSSDGVFELKFYFFNGELKTYKSSFCMTSFYDLYILYLNIKIDRKEFILTNRIIKF